MMPVSAESKSLCLDQEVVLDHLPVGLCLLQQDWSVVFWNRCLEKWSGISRDNILSHSLFDVFPFLAATQYEGALRKIFDDPEAETQVFDSNGMFFSVTPDLRGDLLQRITISPLPSNAFKDRHAMILVENLSDESLQPKWLRNSQESPNTECRDGLMAQKALHRLGRLHELILQSVGSGILGLDRDGNILFANPSAARMLGWEIEELVGKNMHRLLRHHCPGHTAEGTPECVFSAALEEGQSCRVPEDWFQRKNGIRFPVEYVGTPIVEEGKNVGLVVTFNDISTRRFLEQEIMRYTLKLEEEVDRRTKRVRELEQRRMKVEKLAALAQVAAGVAHEINNPLAGIKNAFHLVKKAIPPTHPRFKYVGKIEHEIDRIAGIIKRMYQLYQPDPPARRHVCLRDMVQDLHLILDPLLAKHGVALEIEFPTDQPLMRLPVRDLIQVLCNLVQNAAQASLPNQTIHLKMEVADQVIRFFVVDQAGGISANVLPHIFEPFFTTKGNNPHPGMGLGLSVSQSLIEALGGRIDVQVTPSVGSTFIVEIPYSSEKDITWREG